jgi:hypothetical protein
MPIELFRALALFILLSTAQAIPGRQPPRKRDGRTANDGFSPDKPDATALRITPHSPTVHDNTGAVQTNPFATGTN